MINSNWNVSCCQVTNFLTAIRGSWRSCSLVRSGATTRDAWKRWVFMGSNWDIIMFIIQLLSYHISHHINQLVHDSVYQPIEPSWDIGVLVLKRRTSRHRNDVQNQAEKNNPIKSQVGGFFSTQNSDMKSELDKTPTITCHICHMSHTLCTYPFCTMPTKSILFVGISNLKRLFFVSPQQVLEVPGLLESYPNYEINLYVQDTNWYWIDK